MGPISASNPNTTARAASSSSRSIQSLPSAADPLGAVEVWETEDVPGSARAAGGKSLEDAVNRDDPHIKF